MTDRTGIARIVADALAAHQLPDSVDALDPASRKWLEHIAERDGIPLTESLNRAREAFDADRARAEAEAEAASLAKRVRGR